MSDSEDSELEYVHTKKAHDAIAATFPASLRQGIAQGFAADRAIDRKNRRAKRAKLEDDALFIGGREAAVTNTHVAVVAPATVSGSHTAASGTSSETPTAAATPASGTHATPSNRKVGSPTAATSPTGPFGNRAGAPTRHTRTHAAASKKTTGAPAASPDRVHKTPSNAPSTALGTPAAAPITVPGTSAATLHLSANPMQFLASAMEINNIPESHVWAVITQRLVEGLSSGRTTDTGYMSTLAGELEAMIPEHLGRLVREGRNQGLDSMTIIKRMIDVGDSERKPCIALVFNYHPEAGLVGLRYAAPATFHVGRKQMQMSRNRSIPWHLVLDEVWNGKSLFHHGDIRQYLFGTVLPKCTVFFDAKIQMVPLAQQLDKVGEDFLANADDILLSRPPYDQDHRCLLSADEISAISCINNALLKYKRRAVNNIQHQHKRTIVVGLDKSLKPVTIYTIWRHAASGSHHWEVRQKDPMPSPHGQVAYLRYTYAYQRMQAEDHLSKDAWSNAFVRAHAADESTKRDGRSQWIRSDVVISATKTRVWVSPLEVMQTAQRFADTGSGVNTF